MADQNTASHWNPAPRRRRALRQSNEPKDARYIREFYRKTLGIEDEDTVDLFVQNTHYTLYYKGDVFIHAGRPATILRFILSGVAHGYCLEEDGQERAVCLSYEYGEPLLGAPTLTSPTTVFMEALTDLEVLEIPIPVIVESFSKNIQNIAVYEHLLSEDRIKEYDLQHALTTLEGRDRYLWFCDRYKEIVDVVPQGVIASYIGIRPQSLSRIKRFLRQERQQNNDG